MTLSSLFPEASFFPREGLFTETISRGKFPREILQEKCSKRRPYILFSRGIWEFPPQSERGLEIASSFCQEREVFFSQGEFPPQSFLSHTEIC